MSGDVGVVESLLSEYQGKNVIKPVEDALQQLGADPPQDKVAEVLSKDPAWRLYDPQIVWDMSGTGVGGVSRGLAELAKWWVLWTQMFDSHTYQVTKCEQLNDWVLSGSEVAAVSSANHEGKGPIFQLWKVREGKVVEMRAFLTEIDAQRAAGASPAGSAGAS